MTLYFKELRFIDPADAEQTLGPNAIRIDGFSVVVYDTEQFMRVCHFVIFYSFVLTFLLTQQHLYHWWGEIVLGSWRVYSAIFPTTSSPPPLPARFILPVRDAIISKSSQKPLLVSVHPQQ